MQSCEWRMAFSGAPDDDSVVYLLTGSPPFAWEKKPAGPKMQRLHETFKSTFAKKVANDWVAVSSFRPKSVHAIPSSVPLILNAIGCRDVRIIFAFIVQLESVEVARQQRPHI